MLLKRKIENDSELTTTMTSRSPSELAERARGSVSKKSLVTTETLLRRFLFDTPIIEYLNEKEQPHYLFRNAKYGIKIISPDNSEIHKKHKFTDDGLNYLLFTDEKVLYLSGQEDGDESIKIQYENISNFRELDSRFHSTIKITMNSDKSYVYKADKNSHEITDAVDYGRMVLSDYSDTDISPKSPVPEKQSQDSTNDSRESKSSHKKKIEMLINNAMSDTVSKKRLCERNSFILNQLGEEEQPHFIFSGNTTEGFKIKDGSSTEEYKAKMTRPDLHAAAFRTVITNQRIMMLLIRGGTLNHTWDLDYSEITSVGLDNTIQGQRFRFDTAGRKYIADVSTSLSDIYKGTQSSEQLTEARDYIRKKITQGNSSGSERGNANESQHGQSSEDKNEEIPAIEKLERLQELHEKGAISKGEFEDKKGDLLDEI